jgi:methionine-rich copper-binding protein CopC
MIKKILVLCAALFIAVPTNAFAHGEMVQSSPAADSNVLTAPAEVSIEFDSKLQTIGDANINLITVTDNQGQIISSPLSVVEGTKISTRLQLTDITGLVLVHYRIVSEDGHPVEGDYSFTVGENPIMISAQGKESVESKNDLSLNTGGIVLVIFLIIFAVRYIIKEKKDKK